MKICTICKKSQDIENFYFNPGTSDNRGSQCKTCDTKLKRIRGRNKKALVVQSMGGKCQKCGYAKNLAALDFHHKEKNKEFLLSKNNPSLERMILESKKCQLLCANCHREAHNPESKIAEIV